MAKTANHAAYRNRFMDATVKAVAEYGIEGATSKKIATTGGLNESYIFRYFFDLKDLKKASFFREEERILTILCDSLATYRKTETPEVCQRKIFHELWEMLMQNRDVTLFLMRYFLSTECRDDVMDAHIDNFVRFCLSEEEFFTAEKMAKEGSASFMTVCQYAAFVHCGLLENSEALQARLMAHVIGSP